MRNAKKGCVVWFCAGIIFLMALPITLPSMKTNEIFIEKEKRDGRKTNIIQYDRPAATA